MAKKLLKKKMDGGPIGKTSKYSNEPPTTGFSRSGYMVPVDKPGKYSDYEKMTRKGSSPKSPSNSKFSVGPKAGSKMGGGLRNGGKVVKKVTKKK